MKRSIALLMLMVVTGLSSLRAHEGMWIPILLDIENMQREGLKLTAEDIYSVNNASLKDAIVHFGGGCTAEVISDAGLILTNHHCGYGAIQQLSSLEHDYLKNGFWAENSSGELACAGLTATFVDRIEDVTEIVLSGIDESTPEEERRKLISERSRSLAEGAVSGAAWKAEVKPFFYGNQFIMIVTKTYSDVRLVGTPPSSIGKFGGDTDNWVWPRHTGDFALFRIYASPENEPADFAEENLPYQPAHSLPVSLKGVKEGDFTMVYGFPGVTDQYLVSRGVEYVTEKVNPVRIAMRESSLEVIDAAMASSDELRIKYAARQSMISNAWKKWIGQNMGLERFNAIEKKKDFEKKFQQKADGSGNDGYKNVLASLDQAHQEIEPYQLARDLFIEFYFYGPQVLNFSRQLDELLGAIAEGLPADKTDALLEKTIRSAKSHFEDYDEDTDRAVFKTLLPQYVNAVSRELQPAALADFYDKYRKNPASYTEYLFDKSILDNENQLIALLEGGNLKKIARLTSDPLYALANSMMGEYSSKIRPEQVRLQTKINEAMRVYVKAQMDLFPDKVYWSDANSTLRVTYGKVEGCIPQDGMAYLPHTTLEGAIHKYVPGDVEFDLPNRLIELYESKDYGRYGQDGKLNVAFLASNHTTGGNSGSPVINANGELIGLNFDRSWESTMSDIMFNPEICRNISVDVRYILFVVDKFAGAGWILDEMNLVEN